jgi:hypothetical protein
MAARAENGDINGCYCLTAPTKPRNQPGRTPKHFPSGLIIGLHKSITRKFKLAQAKQERLDFYLPIVYDLL